MFEILGLPVQLKDSLDFSVVPSAANLHATPARNYSKASQLAQEAY